MRVSSNHFFRNGLTGMQQVQKQLTETQGKISLGKKYLSPSENPVATTKILIFDEHVKLTEQYNRNIVYARNSNNLAEGVLAEVVKSLDKIRELTLMANSSHLNRDDYITLATQIEQYTIEMSNLMNTKDAVGDYLFSGYQGLQKPFVERDGGGYEYLGDAGERRLQVSSDTKITFSFSGKPTFVDLNASSNTIVTKAAEQNSELSTAIISVGNIIDQDKFDTFYPDDYIITFNDPPTTYNLVNRDDMSPVVGDSPAGNLTNIPYEPGEPISFNGIEFYLSGDPQPNDTFYIDSTRKQDVLTGLYRLSKMLRTTADSLDTMSTVEARADFDFQYNAALENIDTALVGVTQERSRIGVILRQLDDIEDMHETILLEAQNFLSDVQDLDYSEAATTLNQESFILQASQASFARISNLTIFNFL